MRRVCMSIGSEWGQRGNSALLLANSVEVIVDLECKDEAKSAESIIHRDGQYERRGCCEK